MEQREILKQLNKTTTMIKKNITLLFSLLFTFLGNLMIFAQWEGGGGPPTPEGVGSPASPIDMYVYILAIAAILFIVLYAKKTQKRQTV